MRRGVTALLASCALLAGCSASPTAVEEDELLQVDGLEVLVAQSLPAQVSVRVHGLLPNPCSSVGTVTQEKSGNTFTVVVPVLRWAQVCAQTVREVEHMVRLDGAFAAGDYVVRVNGMERRFSI